MLGSSVPYSTESAAVWEASQTGVTYGSLLSQILRLLISPLLSGSIPSRKLSSFFSFKPFIEDAVFSETVNPEQAHMPLICLCLLFWTTLRIPVYRHQWDLVWEEDRCCVTRTDYRHWRGQWHSCDSKLLEDVFSPFVNSDFACCASGQTSKDRLTNAQMHLYCLLGRKLETVRF